jgi:hypothetical protein
MDGRPETQRVLLGHFLTRHDAAVRAGVSEDEVAQRPDLLRLGGKWLEEVYFEFQFDESGIKRDIGTLVQRLHGDFEDIEIADWLAHPNAMLNGYTPLQWRARGLKIDRIANAADEAGPVHDWEEAA